MCKRRFLNGCHSNREKAIILPSKLKIKLSIIFTDGKKISYFFGFKDTVADTLRSSLIYKFQCSRCNSTYVGKTTRHLGTRISEHLGVSYRTLLPLTSPPFSAIREHTANPYHQNYKISAEQFKILASAQFELDLLIIESLIIKNTKPNLNNMDSLNLRIKKKFS